MNPRSKTFIRTTGVLAVMVALSGCNAFSRLVDTGDKPQLSAIENPLNKPDYEEVTMPMPATIPPQHNSSSLWRAGAKTFFKDNRAAQVGDLITVVISITDSATTSNATTRTRTNSDSVSATALLGYEGALAQIFPEEIAADNPQLETSSALSNDGNGGVTRSEAISLTVAAVVTQVLPNGNLVISGTQEININYDVRELKVDGVVRREDITTSNQIALTQIAEARVAYGGRGIIEDVQQPRYGSQILDVLMPF